MLRKSQPLNESSVRALGRGLDVLALFAPGADVWTQTEIARALLLPLPTVHRLVNTLVGRGFLAREGVALRLGLALAPLAGPLLDTVPASSRAALVDVARATGETVNLATLHRAEVLYLASIPGTRLLNVQTPVGLRLPAHCTALGKCLLAQLPDRAARDVLPPEPWERRTSSTRTTWRALRRDLVTTREAGFAASEEEYEAGLVSFAVPAGHMRDGGAVALNVSLPSPRAEGSARTRLLGILRGAAEAAA